MEVGVGIEVERGGAKDGDEMEEAGEAESDEEIDTERAEDGLGIGVIAGEDALEDDADDEDVEAKAEDDVGHCEEARIGVFEQPNVLGHRRRAKKDAEDQERAAIADRVNAEENDAAAHHANHVIAEGAVVGEGIENERGEKKNEEEHVTPGGRRSGRGPGW